MPVKLTKLTFGNMRREIPPDSLPLTFRHAIEVTRRLGKRYLWIDCLCIFQDDDDKSDWLKEAAYMDKVYSSTFLNISATGGKDSSEGLFTHRDGELEVFPTIYSCPASTGWFPTAKDLVVVDYTLIDREVNESVLNGRGWVFQERWFISSSPSYWDGTDLLGCRQKFLCERFPEKLPRALDWAHDLKHFNAQSPYSKRDQKLKKVGTARVDVSGLGKRDKLWREIVNQYSATRLSFVDDQAVALSGVAKVLRDTFDDEYIAGLWRCGLEYQLAWYVISLEDANFQRSHIYLAPTWSWLSVGGWARTSKLEPTDQIYIEVLDISLKNRSEDTTGSIMDGFMVLKGRLRPLTLSFNLNGLPSVVMEGQRRDWAVNPDEEMRDGLYVHDQSSVPALDNFGIVVGTTGRAFLPEIADLPYQWGISHEMLLLRCIDRDNGVFKRFGLARLAEVDSAILEYNGLPDLVEESHPFWQTLQVNYANNADFPCVEYNPAQQLHTIILK